MECRRNCDKLIRTECSRVELSGCNTIVCMYTSVLRNCVSPWQKVRLRFPSDLFYSFAIIFLVEESSGANALFKFTVPLPHLDIMLSVASAPLPLHLEQIVADVVLVVVVAFRIFCLLTTFTFQICLCSQQLVHIFSLCNNTNSLAVQYRPVSIFLVTSCATTAGHYLLSVSAAHLFAYLSEQSPKPQWAGGSCHVE